VDLEGVVYRNKWGGLVVLHQVGAT